MTGSASFTLWQRVGITAVIAYALALQAVLFSYGGALHAETAAGPAGIVCSQGAGHSAPDAPATSHDALCCILSCGVSAAPAGPLPALAGIARPATVPVIIAFLPDGPPLARVSGVLPVGSRAPPHLG